ncbi:hypothetical protein DH2020_037393 [Rehmannia glutinosa]|uniref:Uncharacterized protein n=1 Tax=Rehmannia glutinosa TaxID=99300 RepID=A0ABR0V486_REHGL
MEDEIHEVQTLIFPALVCLILFLFWLCKLPGTNKNLPPSPPKLPIFGNLHQLAGSSSSHHTLHSLAQKHGPLMLLHLGSVPVLIVSSADAAHEIMRTHDLTFCDRPKYKAYNKLLYNCKDVSVSPYGEYWRQLKSIFVLHLLTNKRVQSFRYIREQETTIFAKRIVQESASSGGGPVSLSQMFSEFTYDVICRSAFGRKYSDSENGKKFRKLIMTEFVDLLRTLSIGDFVPWLSWISRVNGLDKRVDKVAKGVDDFLEGVIQQHMETPPKPMFDGENFVDIMLQFYNDHTSGVSIDKDIIKALILDVLVAGTHSTSIVLERVMTQLLQHPTVMKKIRDIVKDKHDITDDDLEKMHYLKAVIKETLRYHPPNPLLIPRVARRDVNIKGYNISTGTIVMTNVFAICRDPTSWDEPEKFQPERFLNSSIDFKGLDFELIPFGSGRRGCPGIAFSVTTIEYVLAFLLQKFNWKLPDGTPGHDMDMSETLGVTLCRVHPLLAVPSQICTL